MSEEVLLDLGFLTEEERQLISKVISKDVEIRKQEQSRISFLRKELDHLKEDGLPEDEIEAKNERYCARCQTYFGLVWNKGALCPRCDLRVCKVCRVSTVEDGWICTLCYKVREVKAQSGAWFFQDHKEKGGNLFGSMLVRKSLRRLPGSQSGLGEEKQRKTQPLSYIMAQQYKPDTDYAERNHVGHTDKFERMTDQNSYHMKTNGETEKYVEYSDASEEESDEGSHDGSRGECRSTGTESERSHSKDFESPSEPQEEEEERPGDESATLKADVDKAMPEDQSNVSAGPEEGAVEVQPGSPDVPETPQYPSEDVPGVYVDVSQEPETTERDHDVGSRGPSNPEVSPTVEEPMDSRESALREFSQSFASLQSRPASEISRGDGDERRSSDPRGTFVADNESVVSETSGYVTPTASEDTSSKRTPSISGDEGASSQREEYRAHVKEQTPIIVTPEAENEKVQDEKAGGGQTFRPSSILEFEEDLDVSFSKYGSSLGKWKLKDQLSMGSRESIASYYSNAGGEVYGKYPVTGEIYFGIRYDAKDQEFQVQVHQARDITAVDEKNKVSDPYVKTYLLPDRSRSGKRKTKVKKNTINPVFDEILTYKISYDEILQRTLWLAVWNYDRFGHNDFLGEVLIPIDEYHQSGFSLQDPEPQWYDLCERQADDPNLSYHGEIVVALKYVPPSALVSKKKKKKKKGDEKGELHINIIEANNLIAKDSNGYSDPFCKSYLLPDKSKKTKQKTSVVKKTLNPKWNHHFVYDNVTHEELLDRVLELTVWDFDRGSSNEFLGGVRLGLGAGLQEWDDANSEEQAAWNKVLNNQNDWNQVTLTLRDHMGNHNDRTSVADVDEPIDPSLVEIKPDKPSSLQHRPYGTGNPDEELVRHSEYQRPHDSKIETAMKSSVARLSSPTSPSAEVKSPGARQMTLAEMAKLGTSSSAGKDERKSPSSTPSVASVNVGVKVTPAKDEDSDSLVRHSEFYKGSRSPNVSRRKFADSLPSPTDNLQNRRSTLVDMLQKNEDINDSDNHTGSNLMVSEDFMGSRESIYSVDGIYSNNSVSGEILLSYMYQNGTFKIKIFEARSLTAIDETKNTSNPYVKVYLLPDQSRAGKRKTKTRYATLDPEYNEEMSYKVSASELLTRTLWVSLWSYDRFGRNDFLGEVRIPLEHYRGDGETPKWHTLREMPPDSGSDDRGELVVALMYAPADKKKKGTKSGKLYVKIIEAKNLQGKDSDNLSDPFCKSYLLPDPGKKTKKKTPVMKRNLNPRWDYKFTYDNLTVEELHHRVLELTVWDHDLGTSNDFLGGVRIGLGTGDNEWDDCEGEEVTLWQFLLSKPNTWTQSMLSLRSQMGSRKCK